MTVTAGVVDERDDATLIAAVRGGDTEAYGVLFERHVDAARRLARTLARDGDVDDLVSEAFAKVLPVLTRGGGPTLAFRPYLLTAVRRLDVDRHRALARTRPTDDESVLDSGEPFRDTAVAEFESEAAARAFRSLPERWQVVLWHTEVEGQRPATVAPLLGVSPNAVSQLAHRAREGLRSAFVSMHVQQSGEARQACQTTRANLGAYIRAGLSHREAARVSAHLECCRECTAMYLELVEVDGDLRGLLAPVLLGGAATAYLSDTPVAAAPSALAAAGELLRSGPGKVLTGTAMAGVTLMALLFAFVTVMGPKDPQAGDPGVIAAPPAKTEPGRGGRGKPARPPVAATPAAEAPASGSAPVPGGAPIGRPGGQDDRPDLSFEPGPSSAPVPEPESPPTPADPPVMGVAAPAPDPNQVDLRLSAARSSLGPASVVTVDVTGLAPSQGGMVTVTADQLALSVTLDPRCTLVGVGTATCRLTGPSSLSMSTVTLLAPTTLTFTATPQDGLTDPATGDNTASVTVG